MEHTWAGIRSGGEDGSEEKDASGKMRGTQKRSISEPQVG